MALSGERIIEKLTLSYRAVIMSKLSTRSDIESF